MDVLMLPDYSDGNPYQRRLRDALEARSVSVSMTKGECFALLFGGFRLLPILGALREHGRPDVLHLHWIYPFTIGKHRPLTLAKGIQFLLELAVVRLLGVRIVWTVHNLEEHERRAPRLDRWYRHLLVRLSGRLIVHCESARTAVVDAYDLSPALREKIQIVPHGHYIDCYTDETTPAAARAELDVDRDTTLFLYFGRIREYKNVPALVSAFKQLDRSDATLLVVGSPRNAEVAARITARCDPDDNVRTEFRFVPEDEIQVYMNAADVVTLPFSELLTSGSTMLAMSFGNPVVVPAIGCVDTLVTGDCGFTFDPTVDGSLRDVLAQTMDADLEAVGAANYARAAEFDWGPIGAETASLYREVVAGGE
jgi:glycosyltransferase involved in cell wall biosynthesis